MLIFLGCLKKKSSRATGVYPRLLATLKRRKQARGDIENGSFNLFKIASPEDKGAPFGEEIS